MDLGYLPPLPMGLISVAARDLAFRAIQFRAFGQRLLPGWPVAAVFMAAFVAWLPNSADWGLGGAGFIIAVCLGSLVATAAIAAGWATEPEELERWAIRAAAAAFLSALPILVS